MNTYTDKERGRYKPISCDKPLPEETWPYRGRPTSPDDPQFTINAPKFEKHIYIRQDQIIFDINDQLSMLATARRKPDGTEDEALSQATEKHRGSFVRWISKHTDVAKDNMSAFILERSRNASMNNIKDHEEEDITLLFPDWYDDTSFKSLTDAVHDYVVNAALHEYLVITLTSKDPVTIDKKNLADDALHRVFILVNDSIPGTIKKHQAPF
ncbi:MAG: hypothetical protein K6D91_06040 [Prevotella sp.]|nr:hypothetical protein [Prevotella sp.]